MSFAALTMKPEASAASRSPSSGLRVGAAHDSFEREADRVADTVSGGGRISGLSLSRMGIGQVQRQLMPSPSAEQANRRDSGLSMEEAFLRTELGMRLSRSLSGGPHSEAAEEHAASLRGNIVGGAVARGVIESLAAAKGVLPARVPDIDLGKVYPGLSVHVSYAGPASHPTHGHVAFSVAPRRGGASAAVEAAPHAPPAPAGKEHGAHAATHKAHAVAHEKHSAPHHEAGARREEVAIQRKVDRSAPFVADRSAVDPVLNAPGRPLDPGTRQYMESRIGYDFGSVRVHADSRAADSARAMGAQAYTSGNNVVFGQGRFSPGTTEGRRLIAHELTHVVQQDGTASRAHPVIRRAPAQVQRAPDEDGAADAGSGSWFTNPVDKLKAVVRKIPGFKLFTVILGWDPVSDTKVEQNATNVTHGVLELVPGGEDAFEHIKESGSLERAYKWLGDELKALGFSIAYFKDLVNQALGSVKWGDITDPAGALARVAGFFRPPLEKLKHFALDALDKMLELVVEGVLAGLGGLGVLDVLKKAGAVFKQIVKDPVGFLKNLLKSVGQGFTQFKDNILEHLKNGLVQWLFGEVAATGLTLPKHFDLSGIVGLILQVLGLTYARFRTRLVNIIGETPVAFMEGAFDVLVAMKREGLGAAWKMILEKASSLLDTVMSSVRQWVITSIVTTAVMKLATMFNPVGAVIQAIQTIYKTVMFFIEKTKQIAALANAVFDSVAEIAAGNITQAANFVEKSMGRTIPLILGFLADQIGLGGIGKEIRKIIESIQATVDRAIAKILDFIVGKAKELVGKGKEAVVQAVGWWKERRAVKIGGEDHSLYMDGTEDEPEVMVQSSPKPWSAYFGASKEPADPAAKTAFDRCREIVKLLKKPIKAAKATDTMSKDESKSTNVDDRRKLFNELSEKIALLKLDESPEIPVSIIKYDAPRGDGAGMRAAAPILSEKHGAGSAPNDDPPIWKNLGKLIGTKNYVQGHLLNHNLGGEGRRFNMSPINKKANSLHLHEVEEHVKLWVKKHRVVSYEVRADYGAQPVPEEFKKLRAQERAGGLSDRKLVNLRKRLGEFENEQKLPVRFHCEAYGMAYSAKDKKWIRDDGKFNKEKTDAEHTSPIIKDVPTTIET